MLRHYVNKLNVDKKMTFMYNKQHGLFSFNKSCLHNGQDHQMSLKRHTNHLISSSHRYIMTTFSSSIIFYNVNDNSSGLHELQGYF